MVAQNASDPGHSKVIVFCERHTMLAELNVGQRRLSDVVNDPMHKLLHLEQVRINRGDRMDETVAGYGRVMIRREAVQALMVMVEPVRPAHQRISNYVPKQPVKVAALLPSFHIVGDIFPNKMDAVEFLLSGSESFAVLRNATVTMTTRTDKQITVPTAFLNRAHIELATQL
jgi:hypothetical protein